MSVGSILYGTKTVFPLVSNLTSLANNAAKPLGLFDNSTLKGLNCKVYFQATLNAAGVSSAGFIELWVVESLDNVNWVDNILPTGVADISSNIKNARLIRTLRADTNAQVVRWIGDIGQFIGDITKYFTIVARNKTGAAFGATGHDAQYQVINVEST